MKVQHIGRSGYCSAGQPSRAESRLTANLPFPIATSKGEGGQRDLYAEGTATEKHRRVAAGGGVMAGMG